MTPDMTGGGRAPDPGGGAEAEALARYRSASRRRRSIPVDRERRRSAMRGLVQTPSGPGPDARDPQRVAVVWRGMADGRGWTLQLAVWSLTNRWAEIVGPQVAEHVSVVEFDPDPAASSTGARDGENPAGPAQQSLLPGPPAQAAPGEQPRSGGTLILMADSNAWQQQMVWGLVHLQRRLDAELGRGVVGRIVIKGPADSSRKYGRRRVRT